MPIGLWPHFSLYEWGPMSRASAADAGMKGIAVPAWHGEHYVPPAELLLRLDSFSLELTWHAEFDKIVDPRGVEIGEQVRAL
ncbi:hypothetical protein ACWGH5_37905 [Streptomyces sp. NPDC054864]